MCWVRVRVRVGPALLWGAPVPSAPPWGVPVPSALPWWAPDPPAPPWWASVSALSMLSVSVSPQISDSDMGSCLGYGTTPVWWAPGPSAPPWGAPVMPAPPWWAPVPPAPPWGAPVMPAPPWWATVPPAPPWGAPVPSSPPWLPHGPGPPSLPLFRLRSTALQESFRSVWKPLLGGGAMSRILAMNLQSLTTRGHSASQSHRSLLDYMSHHPLHPHSCSPLITHAPANNLTITITQSHAHTSTI